MGSATFQIHATNTYPVALPNSLRLPLLNCKPVMSLKIVSLLLRSFACHLLNSFRTFWLPFHHNSCTYTRHYYVVITLHREFSIFCPHILTCCLNLTFPMHRALSKEQNAAPILLSSKHRPDENKFLSMRTNNYSTHPVLCCINSRFCCILFRSVRKLFFPLTSGALFHFFSSICSYQSIVRPCRRNQTAVFVAIAGQK